MKAKKIWTGMICTALLLLVGLPVVACEACKKQQPKLLQGITHGSGPDSNWDYLIVSIMVVITAYSFYAMIKCLAKSRDKAHQNIKTIILN
ncbi:hypothetical protein [Mucilaginibacter sp.]|jgi:hypothetical protein|uniref:hypothetical protein n=1 Tax=Mucilaginibacter sp. TaxID=1882438 RepID=UPI002BC65EB7|nr:hypothetical protein [Mucilaginibacter sp.]HTI58940.1 hypothetical protein [Mucilaginibacter sp.]